MTGPEKLLWSQLNHRQQNGLKFRKQHPIAQYIVDFYCREAALCIELDGDQHGYAKAIIYDEKRTLVLNHRGLTVLRFWNHEVINNLEGVLETIVATANDRQQTTKNTPSPERGGLGRGHQPIAS